MATTPKPVILNFSLGDWKTDPCHDPTRFGTGLDNLLHHANVERVCSVDEAHAYLTRNAASPPAGILVTDPGMQKLRGSVLSKDLSVRLKDYAYAGGTVVVGHCFSEIMRDEERTFWRDVWGLPWEPGLHLWLGTDLILNGSALTLRGKFEALQNDYIPETLCLRNVKPEHAWYLLPGASATQPKSVASDPNYTNQSEAAVVFAPFGKGMVGYTGGANMEIGTKMAIMRMFGF